MTEGSMKEHRRSMHWTEPVIDWNRLLVSQTEHLPQVYDIRFRKNTMQFPCTFHG